MLQLDLHDNNFTRVGLVTLVKATFDNESLDALRASNHTCRLRLAAAGRTVPRRNENVLAINGRTAFPADAFLEEFKRQALAAAGTTRPGSPRGWPRAGQNADCPRGRRGAAPRRGARQARARGAGGAARVWPLRLGRGDPPGRAVHGGSARPAAAVTAAVARG